MLSFTLVLSLVALSDHLTPAGTLFLFFIMCQPSQPCQLCPTDQYMHHTTTIEFNDDEVTCRSASNFLMEREDMSSDSCSTAKATIGETCCYSICNICGEYDLDWDVFINFEDKDMSCGDFNEIFREQAIVDGTEQCDALTADYFDTCCYTSVRLCCSNQAYLIRRHLTNFSILRFVPFEFTSRQRAVSCANRVIHSLISMTMSRWTSMAPQHARRWPISCHVVPKVQIQFAP